MKYLGIDYGSKRVGTAVSDADGMIAFPRITIDNDDKLLPGIMKLVTDEKIEHIIVGDTRTFSGASNDITEDAEKFIQTLTRETGKPVSRAFEVFSSIEAARYAPEGTPHNDSAAAAIILQRFLDMKGEKK
jgi:putative Holliday junction resolvase